MMLQRALSRNRYPNRYRYPNNRYSYGPSSIATIESKVFHGHSDNNACFVATTSFCDKKAFQSTTTTSTSSTSTITTEPKEKIFITKDKNHDNTESKELFNNVENKNKSTATTDTSTAASTAHERGGLYRLLSDKERKLLAEQQSLTDACKVLASQVGGSIEIPSSGKALEELQLQASFTVVVAGEFNTGKSTLINALLGQSLLESGSLPTTDAITILANTNDSCNNNHANNNDNISTRNVPSGIIFHSVQAPLLQDLTIVDTPGTNAVWIDHTSRTMRLLPAADMILFVTSADRPFSDSERTLLKNMQKYRKSIVVVINKMDILDASGGDHGKTQKESIVNFVTENAAELLGARPIVLPISSRDALSAKLMGKQSNVWQRSNFEALEHFLKDSLTAETKLKAKLSSPIGVVEGIIAQCLDQLKEQKRDLEVDVATLNILQSQVVGWRKEMLAELSNSRHEMGSMLMQEGDRCDLLLDRIKLYEYFMWSLFDKDKLQQQWDDTKTVMLASPNKTNEGLEADLLYHVKETADLVATRARAQGQSVIEYLGQRPAIKHRSLVGSITGASRFDDTRKHLTERLQQAVQGIFSNVPFNEHEKIFESMRQTAILSASCQFSAAGSAAAVTMGSIDPLLGAIASSSIVLGGGLLYSYQNSNLRKQHRTKWMKRKDNLNSAAQTICENELDRLDRRIMDGVSPYVSFVKHEQERIEELTAQSEDLFASCRNLRKRIGQL